MCVMQNRHWRSEWQACNCVKCLEMSHNDFSKIDVTFYVILCYVMLLLVENSRSISGCLVSAYGMPILDNFPGKYFVIREL